MWLISQSQIVDIKYEFNLDITFRKSKLLQIITATFNNLLFFFLLEIDLFN